MARIALVVDTETAGGWPSKSKPLADPSQPHMVQLAWVLLEAGRCVEASSRLVCPDGWTVSAETEAIHGISTEMATRHGVSLEEVMAPLSFALVAADILVAHNAGFDVPVLEIAAARCQDVGPALASRLATKRAAGAIRCTMMANVGSVNANFSDGRPGKWPSLAQTHAHYFGSAHESQHDALGDVQACARIWLEMERRKAETCPAI